MLHDLRNRVICQETRLLENWEKQELSLLKVPRNVNLKMV